MRALNRGGGHREGNHDTHQTILRMSKKNELNSDEDMIALLTEPMAERVAKATSAEVDNRGKKRSAEDSEMDDDLVPYTRKPKKVYRSVRMSIRAEAIKKDREQRRAFTEAVQKKQEDAVAKEKRDESSTKAATKTE